MIDLCPFCGKYLQDPIADSGITTCQNCNKVFDDSSKYRLLSASWACKQNELMDVGFLKDYYHLTNSQLELIGKVA